ncbi:MAG: hypothetical protein M3380_07540, partial [Chloroflexota bacterium]|nr:hypothetical protein [Chloroflexota bacterium]
MSNAAQTRRLNGVPPSATSAIRALGDAARSQNDAVISIAPEATIEEIVAQVEASSVPRLDLLVPNGTRALQSRVGCKIVARAASDAGIRVTLFTADEQTAEAAHIAELDVVGVRGAILPPTTPTSVPKIASGEEPGGRHQGLEDEGRRSGDSDPTFRRPPPGSRPSTPDSRPPVDDGFLDRLRAFDQAQSSQPPPAGDILPTTEGAVLFDAAGDLGVPRPSSPRQAAWESAFEEMGATMAAEPMAPVDPLGAVPRQPPSIAEPSGHTRAAQPARLRSIAPRLPWRRQSVVSEDEVEPEDPVSRPQLATVRRPGRPLRWPLAILG